MSFIDKIKIENTDYDIQDTEARKLIEKCLTEESDPTVPKHVKEITQEKITEWDNKSNFSGQYDDLQGLPDLSKFALESDIPTDYLKEIPSEYITEDELNKALENMPSGSAIPEITENTNIFDLETGVYYVNAGVTLTITNLSTTLDNEEPNIQIYVKSILNVLRCYDPENFSQVYYKLITFNGDTSDGNMVGYYEGYIDGSHGGSQTAWLCKYPVYMEMKNITTLANKVVELTSEATDEQYPSAKAVYDYVNSAIGTALDGEY